MDENQAVQSGQILEQLKNQNRMMRALLIVVSALLAVMIIAGAVLVPKTVRLMGEAQTAVENLTEVSGQLARTDINKLVKDTEAFLKEAGDGITDTVEIMETIDFEGLNSAIGDLQATASALASLFKH